MELFSDYDLNQRVNRIKSKIDAAANPNRMEEITENGISIARRLLEDTRDDLEYIKNKVGSSNENYIEVAEAIALAASGCIKFPVSFMMMLPHASDFHQTPGLKGEVKSKLGEAARLMAQISSMPMKYEARQMINRVTQMITQTETKITGGSGGCFIATFAYESYDAKEVLFLRYYRDNVLGKSKIGMFFIKVYYLLSPSFVKVFVHFPAMRKVIKMTIDKIINKIKKV